jgi:hypothetical protein
LVSVKRLGTLAVSWLACAAVPAAEQWTPLDTGLDAGVFSFATSDATANAGIVVLRIDPRIWDLKFRGLSTTGESKGMTARQWCKRHNLTAAINAGMFAADSRTHLGYLRSGKNINNGLVNAYRSVAAASPLLESQSQRFHIFDLDDAGMSIAAIQKDYALVVQNLRLLKRPGMNRWAEAPRRWSEAALGEDAQGRILFIFARSPFTMHDFNRALLSLDIGVVAAQHLEGGPEAQLYWHVGKDEREGFGSYETSFRENDSNAAAWPIPNVLGIQRRAPANQDVRSQR